MIGIVRGGRNEGDYNSGDELEVSQFGFSNIPYVYENMGLPKYSLPSRYVYVGGYHYFIWGRANDKGYIRKYDIYFSFVSEYSLHEICGVHWDSSYFYVSQRNPSNTVDSYVRKISMATMTQVGSFSEANNYAYAYDMNCVVVVDSYVYVFGRGTVAMYNKYSLSRLDIRAYSNSSFQYRGAFVGDNCIWANYYNGSRYLQKFNIGEVNAVLTNKVNIEFSFYDSVLDRPYSYIQYCDTSTNIIMTNPNYPKFLNGCKMGNYLIRGRKIYVCHRYDEVNYIRVYDLDTLQQVGQTVVSELLESSSYNISSEPFVDINTNEVLVNVPSEGTYTVRLKEKITLP